MLSSSTRRVATQTQRRGILGISAALDKRIYRAAKGVMPAISKTEQIALGCGTIGFDRDIFSGSPSLKHLVKTYDPKLSPEEESFMNKQVNELCALLNDHEVSMNKDFTKEAWDYMRDEKFFGLKIPKEWGGLGFSTQAVSQILAKLATQCFDANATVAVPNSLGPGELLARYGTPTQKEYFLPRLADGTLIPCFGLTGPHSGSDATSLIGSTGVVEERNGVLGVNATFSKVRISLLRQDNFSHSRHSVTLPSHLLLELSELVSTWKTPIICSRAKAKEGSPSPCWNVTILV